MYRTDIAAPARAAELDAQAQQVIAGNIANSPGAIAARYELAYQRSGWAVNQRRCIPAEKRWRSDRKQRHLPTKSTQRAGASMR
ncbi:MULTISPECIES: hypothetical protein [Xanthomonas]|uniref:Uncharacterized protein n=1 Tax=Xanthomonas cucurbitae TaxID=56453 RepID=A0ABY7YAG3_9XANT|nr:hypothetical protein [Xanthomonas cucurbitae]WDM66965.1 hypothetical protein K6981_15880 [Xanthomonas cucurbitae]WDM70841.1 hypothetical protein K6978_15850 [Xanthomonas cucurbitae]WDM74668.1 hypothetical protein K6982_14945 [Xanthomonas cucurbitae]WDM79883.1 hypothetical protein K6980_03935 [Xanthomonas cucurbitae]WDM83575.1 hypothetical protein K6979_03945 [Xanthomonas cucurbitae]